MNSSMSQDIRYALRSFARRPGVTAAILLTFALGVGATTVLLTVVDQVLVRPLVYEDSDRIYSVWGVTEGFDRLQPSYPDFRDWREAAQGLHLAFAYGDVLSMGGVDGAAQVPTAFVSDGFFDVLRSSPSLGRTFAREEESTGQPVVVVSHGFWLSRLGGASEATGSSIELSGIRHTIVGVMPVGFAWPEWADVWVPLERLIGTDPALEQRDARVDTRAVTRLDTGVGPAAASAELQRVARDLAERYPETNSGLSLRLSFLRDEVVGDVRPTLLVLLAAAGLVLLIACANVASLLLARTVERSREFAVRTALGASRRRIVRQLLIESLILGTVGGAFGIFTAMIGVNLLSGFAAGVLAIAGIPVPRLQELGVDPRALGLASGVALSASLLFGLSPVAGVLRRDPVVGLREGGRSGGAAPWSFRVYGILAGVQVGVAVALLGTAGLLGTTLDRLRERTPGFDLQRLVTLRVFPPPSYTTGAERLALYDVLAERVGALSGVAGVALTNHMEFAGGLVTTSIRGAGTPVADSAIARYRTVSPGFFQVTGMSVRQGRGFYSSERASPVVVVNESLASSLWPGQPVVGRSVLVANPTPPSERRGEVFEAEVVGVVADTPDSPRESPAPKVYVPHGYDPWGNATIVVRAEGDPVALVSSIRQAVRDVEPDIPVADVRPLPESVRRATMRESVIGATMGGFAVVAFLLSVVGTYGALANLVRRRFDEFGIRMALGASPQRIQRGVLERAALILAPALVLGAAGTVALGHLLKSVLFGVTPTHVPSLLFGVGTLAAVGLLAGWLPSLRAARIDPSGLMRSE